MRGIHPIIALSATKDVQDAILADKKRYATVDVIDFRYWWRTDKGEFAPPGGKNLAPRQFERQWKGGRPNELNLANMAAEYRAIHTGKAVICDFDNAGWAWICAGGSLPRLPKTTDAKLLAAIPRMTPIRELSGDGRWLLGEPGKQILIYRSRLDSEVKLNVEVSSYRVSVVNPRTGEVSESKFEQASGKTKLPDANLLWLTKE